MTAAEHYRQAALQEMDALRKQLDKLARCWNFTGVFGNEEARSDMAGEYVFGADQLLGRLYDHMANDGLDQQARAWAALDAQHAQAVT